MTTTIREITARKRTPRVELIWFDGKNALEVARWLQAHRKSVEVKFHSGGETLWIHGNGRTVPEGQEGIWIDDQGNTVTKAQLEREFEVVSER